MDIAQGVDVEFGNDESAVAGKSAAENAGRLDDLVHAGLDQPAQLGVGTGAAHAAVDVQRNRARLARDAQARQKRVVGELVEVVERQAAGKTLLHAQPSRCWRR